MDKPIDGWTHSSQKNNWPIWSWNEEQKKKYVIVISENVLLAFMKFLLIFHILTIRKGWMAYNIVNRKKYTDVILFLSVQTYWLFHREFGERRPILYFYQTKTLLFFASVYRFVAAQHCSLWYICVLGDSNLYWKEMAQLCYCILSPLQACLLVSRYWLYPCTTYITKNSFNCVLKWFLHLWIYVIISSQLNTW